MKLPRDTQLTCPSCGFRTKLTSRRMAEHSIRLHKCERHLEINERSERFWARLAQVDRTPKPCHHKRVEHEHGTRLAYTCDRCRCWPCTRARGDADVQIRKDKAYGRSLYVPADAARAHVERVRAAGWGLKTISAESGVSYSSLGKLVYGFRGRPPSVRITRSTEQRILAVPLPTVRQLGSKQHTPAVGAMRRLRALAVLGWSTQEMCRRAGIGYQGFYAVISGRYDTCYVRTWVAIADLYEQLWQTLPPETTKGERISARKTRRLAAQRGWAPALAWDDDTIDDPRAHPAMGEDIDDMIDVFIENAVELWEIGLPADRILRQLDVTASAAEKRFSRRRGDHPLTREFRRAAIARRRAA